MSSNDLPYIHGMRVHGPHQSDPTATGPLILVVAAGGAAWSSGTNYSGGDTVQDSLYQYMALQATGPSGTVSQPGVTSGWPSYWIIQAPVFQNSWTNMTATMGIPNPVPAGYRLVNGPPNVLSRTDGSIDHYLDHALDIFGDVTGGATGTTVFTVPPAFRLAYDKPVPGHDNTMAYVASRLYSATGNFVRGTA